MKNHPRGLLTALIGTAVPIMLSSPSLALGLPDPLNYDMGPLGNWALSGGISGFGAAWNNNIPNTPGPTEHGGTSGDFSIDNAIGIINKTDGQLQFTIWAGIPPNTPVMGYNSPNVGPSLNAFGNPLRNGFGHASPLFKGYATYQPVDWFSLQAGRLPSPDGTEIGVDWFNPTAFVSDLNNMQTTTADGAQVNFIAGADKAFYGVIPGYGSTLTIRIADGYKTGHANELGFTGLWNLTSDGSDNIVAFGHTRLDPAGNITGNTGFVAGFGTVNADLIGIGGAYVLGSWTISPELEYQWLPKDIVSGVNAPLTTYSNTAAQVTFTYQIDEQLVHRQSDPIHHAAWRQRRPECQRVRQFPRPECRGCGHLRRRFGHAGNTDQSDLPIP